jgi:hypothetical protein
LQVKEDPEVTRLAYKALPGNLINPYKRVIVYKHLVQAIKDRPIERQAVL